jgi:hypothetical protein
MPKMKKEKVFLIAKCENKHYLGKKVFMVDFLKWTLDKM